MPRGDYIRTEEHKRKMSESHQGINKGIKQSEESKQKKRNARYKRKAELGYINSPETRKKMSNTHKGKKLSVLTRANMSLAKRGRKRSKEFRNKLSEANKGSKNPSWKGGISPEHKRVRSCIEFKLWREAVLMRDNFACQRCHQQGGKLVSHHILNFSTYLDLRFAIDNGITLCDKCHGEFHKIYGKNNNTKEQLDEFLTFPSF